MKKKHTPFNVLVFEINGGGSFVPYDVMPYFLREWDEIKNSKKRYAEDRYRGKPETMDELRQWLTDKSHYMFWSRCEWELIVAGWPCTDVQKKIDVHDQIEMNLDLVVRIFAENINFKFN